MASAVVGEEVLGHGTGRSKKEAEQRAAEQAWATLDGRRQPRPRSSPRSRDDRPAYARFTDVRYAWLPEVETVRRGLEAFVVGRRIETAEFRGARVVRRHVPGAADLSARVEQSVVTGARRRGKYLWLVLEPRRADQGLLMHLGMSGQLLVQPPDAAEEKHLHARFSFADGQTELRFVDQRTFGGVALAELDDHGIPEPIAHIAPDPLEAAWDGRRSSRG